MRLSKARVADPETAGIERVVGLEHIEPGDLRIRRWGDVADGTTFTTLFKPGQVLFGKRRAYQRKVAVADFEGVCSGDIYVLEPANDRLMPELLPFLCQTDAFFDHAVGTSAGSLSPRTNWTSLASFQFPLPPIQEQARLVEALSAADKLAEVQHDLFTSAESVFSALLKDRIGRGFKPADYQGWEEDDEPNMCFVRLSDVASVDRGRFSHRPRNLPQFFGGPYPFAQTGDVAAARGRDFSASQFLSDEGVQYSKSFPAGTIFLTIAAVIAATAISTAETYCTDSVVGVVPRDPSDVDYLEYTLRFTRPYLEFEVATQTAQKNINLEVLRPLTIPWPSKEDRDAIAKELAGAESVIRSIEARQAATKQLMHEMLRANFEVPA
ncbi:MAG: restriction endonuclease subunit S [Novosphingobium sp.]|nr:restriction endonuclease subunit S [Novosphingobium sp.]